MTNPEHAPRPSDESSRDARVDRLLDDVGFFVDGAGYRALVALPEADEATLVRDQLLALRYEVLVARDRVSAEGELSSGAVDLIIADATGSLLSTHALTNASREAVAVVTVGEAVLPGSPDAELRLSRPLAPERVVATIHRAMRSTKGDAVVDAERPDSMHREALERVRDLELDEEDEGLDFSLVDAALDLDVPVESGESGGAPVSDSAVSSAAPTGSVEPSEAVEPTIGWPPGSDCALEEPIPTDDAELHAVESEDAPADPVAWWRFFFEARRSLRRQRGDGPEQRVVTVLNAFRDCLAPRVLCVVEFDPAGARFLLDDRAPREPFVGGGSADARWSELFAELLTPGASECVIRVSLTSRETGSCLFLARLDDAPPGDLSEMTEELRILLEEARGPVGAPE